METVYYKSYKELVSEYFGIDYKVGKTNLNYLSNYQKRELLTHKKNYKHFQNCF